jgi:hypothetical protein
LVVGTVLTLINQGESLLHGPPGVGLTARIGLTYLVPFLVSLFAMRGTIPDLRAGQRSAWGGAYRCRADAEHADLARVGAGERLPPCPTCGSRAKWVPLES